MPQKKPRKNPQQQRFVDEFVIDCNGAAAARRAGYSEKTAKQQATRLLADPVVAAEIKVRLDQLKMSAEEATKRTTDVARTRLNDFLTIRRELKTPFVRKPLQQLINELDNEMSFEDEFARIAKLSTDDLKKHHADQKVRELQGIRYALELERNPLAYRDVPGESEWVEVASLDLVAIARAKDVGSIKSYKVNRDGSVSIEMYDAANAAKLMLELHGKLIRKVASTDPEGNPLPPAENPYKNLTDEQLAVLDAIGNQLRPG